MFIQDQYQFIFLWILQSVNIPPPFLTHIEPHSVDLKGVGPNLAGVSERNAGDTRPRALSQSAMHSFERGDRGNPKALAELAQARSSAWNYGYLIHYFNFLECKM